MQALSEEDRLTILRWIDLGCPLDRDYDPSRPQVAGLGWSLDDTRPTLAVTWPQPGKNSPADRILIGMTDYGSGLAPESFRVSADFTLAGVKPGENLAARFRQSAAGVWELRLGEPLRALQQGLLTVSVRDKQGNETRIARSFAVE